MSIAAEQLVALRQIYPEARVMAEGGAEYVFIPGIKVTVGDQVRELDGLLHPSQSGGYSTRLYLSAAVPERQQNWQASTLLGRTWHTWSWNNVPATIPLARMLCEHLVALR